MEITSDEFRRVCVWMLMYGCIGFLVESDPSVSKTRHLPYDKGRIAVVIKQIVFKINHFTKNQLFSNCSRLYFIRDFVFQSRNSFPAASAIPCPAAVSHSIVGAKRG